MTRAAGFSLLETLVALAIASLGLVAAYEGLAKGAFTAKRVADRAVETTLAETKLAEAGVLFPIETGEISGVEQNGALWTIRITPYTEDKRGEETVPVRIPQNVRLYKIEVETSASVQKSTSFRLATIKRAGP